jgi:hypothetical protein
MNTSELIENAGRKVTGLRIEKDWQDDMGRLTVTFNEVVKDAEDKIVSKTTLAQWSVNTVDFPNAVQDSALAYGFLQKYGDAYAGAGKKEYTIGEVIEILDDMAANHKNGDWNKPGRTKSEKVKAVSEEAIDAVLESNPLFAEMDRDTAIALVKSLGLMKK